MTKITRNNNIRSGGITSDSSIPKTPTDSAILAQQLGSESSWADRYVPSTPGETIMTPGSSVADHTERSLDTEFMTLNEAPPTYEEVASSSAPSQGGPPRARGLPPSFQAQTPRRPNLPGRSYSRHETSQSITGTFTLHDSLNLTTTSGTISISLDVQPGDEPARLNLKTSSGSISIHDKQADTAMTRSTPTNRLNSRSNSGGLFSFLLGSRSNQTQVEPPPVPTSDDPRKQSGQHLTQPEQPTSSVPPARVILTTIESSSGSINGHLLVTATSSLSISTTSGSINLRLVSADSSSSSSSSQSPNHPLSKLEAEDSRLTSPTSTTRDLTSTLLTTSKSGSQSITINTGLRDTSAGALISAIRARHHSLGSASVHCSYPREWEGLVHASVGGSGTVSVHGNGLQLDRRGSKEVWAWRGADLPDVETAVEVRCDGSGTVGFVC